MSKCISTAHARAKQASWLWARRFCCKFTYNESSVMSTCISIAHACAKRGRYRGARHFSCTFLHKMVLATYPTVVVPLCDQWAFLPSGFHPTPNSRIPRAMKTSLSSSQAKENRRRLETPRRTCKSCFGSECLQRSSLLCIEAISHGSFVVTRSKFFLSL